MRCLTVEECRLWRKENSSRSNWKRQVTFLTPDDRLPWFSREVVAHLAASRAALLIIDTVVFTPRPQMAALRAAAGGTLDFRETPGVLFSDDQEGLIEGLYASLLGWCDFRILCSPSGNALRADHDAFTTFFSTSPGRIAEVRRAMKAAGVPEVEWEARHP